MSAPRGQKRPVSTGSPTCLLVLTLAQTVDGWAVVIDPPEGGPCRTSVAPCPRLTLPPIRFSSATRARPRCPCARSSSHRVASCGSAASAACAARRTTSRQSHGEPCRRRPGPCPCAGQHRCRPIRCRRHASSRRVIISVKGSFAPGDCSVQPPHLGSFAASLRNQIRTARTGRCSRSKRRIERSVKQMC